MSLRRVRGAVGQAVERLEARRLLSTAVYTYHNDNASTGQNLTESALTSQNVNAATFGKQWSAQVDGEVYAQPLYAPGVFITAGPQRGTVHDVVYVATEHDSLYALDAVGGNLLWKTSLIDPNNSITTVPAGDTGSTDISNEVGITSTPLIDPNSNTIYLVARTKEVRTDGSHYLYRLHAIDLGSGAEKLGGPAVMGDTKSNGRTYTYVSGPYVVGTGDGAVTVNGQSRVYFNALREMNRPALTLVNGHIYIAFASLSDIGPYHGWVLGYNASTLQLFAAFNATPNGSEGGIWQGGGKIAVDPGSGPNPVESLYLETGNGSFNSTAANFNSAGFPVDGDYGDSFLKLTPDPSSSQTSPNGNANGFGLKVADYFTPFNQTSLAAGDVDLGSGGVMLLPDSAGSAAHRHLLLGAGKEGRIYLIDRDNLGHFNAASDHIVQEQAAALALGSMDTASYFDGSFYYVPCYSPGYAVAFSISNATFSVAPTSTSPDTFGFPGATTSISADGTSDGIVWAIDHGTSELRAYDAADLSHELYRSDQAGQRDALLGSTKFGVPTVADGRVFVGTSDPSTAGTANQIVAFGLLSPPTQPPAVPSDLTAAAYGTSLVSLSWQDNSNTENFFAIDRSTDGTDFSLLTTAAVNQTTFLDSSVQPLTHYWYRVRATNAAGSSGASNVVQVITPPSDSPADLYHFDEGSGTAAADSAGGNTGTLVGSPPPAWIAGYAGSALSFLGDGTPDSVASESAVNTSRDLSGILGGTASLAFWIRTTQLGSDDSTLAPGVTGVAGAAGNNDIRWGYIDASGRIGIQAGSASPALSLHPINDDAWHHVVLTRDSSTGVKAVYVDGALDATVGGDTGAKTAHFSLIGAVTDLDSAGTRTGATYFNGELDELRIYRTILSAGQAATLGQVPAAPANLLAIPVDATRIELTWNLVGENVTGFQIERSINGAAFTQIAQAVGGTDFFVNSGLSPNTTYAYRVRATNFAGESGYAESASIILQAVPATPTGLHASLVESDHIDLQWYSGSGGATGLVLLRGNGEGTFRIIASLAPGTTSYRDVDVASGVTYDYRLFAYNSSGYSDFAGTMVQALAAAPTNIAAEDGAGQIELSWDASAGATGYTIYRATLPDFSDALLLAGQITETRFIDTGLVPGTLYYYAVSAIDDRGEGPRSEIVYATARLPGDVNGDGSVDFTDLLMLAQNYGNPTATYDEGDLNDDGTVNFQDLLILAQHYSASLPPGAFAASGTGGAVLPAAIRG